MPGIATGVVSYLGDICGTRGDIQDTALVDVLFKTLYVRTALPCNAPFVHIIAGIAFVLGLNYKIVLQSNA